MRVLGIDCGTERTGYGVIDSDGRAHRMVAAGCIRSSARDPLERRLLNIAGALRELIAEYRPDSAAVEEVFFAVNAKSALKLSHVRGVALLLIAEASVDLAEYSPLEVKMSVVGYGRAEKSQVQQMVASLLRLAQPLESEDASDALWRSPSATRRTRAVSRSGASSRVTSRLRVPLSIFALALFLAAASPDTPRLSFSKSFPGSAPPWVEITIDKTGAGQYKEDPKDEDPLKFQLSRAELSQIFDLADKLDHFSHPLESGLKVANMGMKTFRYEADGHSGEVKFNYSEDMDARALTDSFERIAEDLSEA